VKGGLRAIDHGLMIKEFLGGGTFGYRRRPLVDVGVTTSNLDSMTRTLFEQGRGETPRATRMTIHGGPFPALAGPDLCGYDGSHAFTVPSSGVPGDQFGQQRFDLIPKARLSADEPEPWPGLWLNHGCQKNRAAVSEVSADVRNSIARAEWLTLECAGGVGPRPTCAILRAVRHQVNRPGRRGHHGAAVVEARCAPTRLAGQRREADIPLPLEVRDLYLAHDSANAMQVASSRNLPIVHSWRGSLALRLVSDRVVRMH
jgi:hypothetical protein